MSNNLTSNVRNLPDRSVPRRMRDAATEVIVTTRTAVSKKFSIIKYLWNVADTVQNAGPKGLVFVVKY